MIRFLVIFLIITTTSVFSEIKKVNIVGNTRVNPSTIESLVDKKISNIDSIYINNLTKKIYDTDFFSDVKISYNLDILTEVLRLCNRLYLIILCLFVYIKEIYFMKLKNIFMN